MRESPDQVRQASAAPSRLPVRRHLAAAGLFSLLGLVFTWPLALNLRGQLPGTDLDDNVLFLWNFWLLRRALADPLEDFFTTTAMFHPGGVDLVLHSHSLLNAFAGATLFGWLPLPAALNLTIIAACALNGLSAYLLAYQLTRRWLASVAAGVCFAGCPLFTMHLFAHFNYYTAWPLVLFVSACLRAMHVPSWRSACLAGVLLAAVAYTDYYYFVYACVFAGLVFLGRALDADLVPRDRRSSRLDSTILVLALAVAAAAVAIQWSGGAVWQVGSLRLSLRTGTNVRAAATALFLWWAWRRRRWSPVIRVPRPFAVEAVTRARPAMFAGIFGVCALLLTPILARAFAMWRAGEYVTQAYMWRSAPAGIDAGALIAGNPFNPIWGRLVIRLYDVFGMNPFDNPLWLGIVPLVLLLTRASWMRERMARAWVLVAAVFFVWALGPFLTLFGINTGLPLPQILFRYVPVLSNARIPGHAAVFFCLGLSVLLAFALTTSRLARAPGMVIGVMAVVFVDFLSVPFPTVPLIPPPLYERLAQRPAGAVLDIPAGIRDGFGVEGRFDASVIYYQTIHGKPIVTGYVARLPPAVRQRYHDSPVMRTLFALSADAPAAAGALDPAAGYQELKRDWHVRYVVVHEAIAHEAVRRFVEATGARLIDRDQSRLVYALE